MTNLFSQAADTSNPFEGLTDEPVGVAAGLTEDQVDRTARMAAIAKGPIEAYQDLTATYAEQIRQSGDEQVRIEAASKQQMAEVRGLMKLAIEAPQFDPTGELVAGSQLAAQAAVAEDIERRKEYALEQQTLERIQDLAAAGDYTQAKILTDNIRLGGAEDRIRDINVKRMILSREVEKAGIAVEDQGWFKHVVDFTMSVVGDLTFNNSMDRNNIVDIDEAHKKWWDWLISGKRQRNEAAALWTMAPADFAKAVREQVIPRIKDHSTTFGYTNNTQVLSLLSGIADTPETWKTDLGDASVIAGLLPFGLLGKISKVNSIPYLMARSGARKESAEILAQTSLASVRSGAADAAKMTGVSTDEVIANTLPTAMNVTGPEHTVPLTGDALAAIERGEALLKALPEFIQPGRLTPTELQNAIQKTHERLSMEIGRPLKDFKHTELTHADGSKTTRFEFLIGKKKGGGFANAQTAKEWAWRNGIGQPDLVSTSTGTIQKLIDRTMEFGEKELRDMLNDPDINGDVGKLGQHLRDFITKEGGTVELRVGKKQFKVSVKDNRLVDEEGLPWGVQPFLQQLPSEKDAIILTKKDIEVVADESGQWFIKETRDLNESGFYTNNLSPLLQNTGIVGRMTLSARRVGDEFLQTLDRTSANSRNKIMKSMRDKYAKTFGSLATDERDTLGQVMAWGENKSTWLSNDDIDELFARLGRKPPSDNVYEAYHAARDINDIEFILRNDVEFKRMLTHGFETVSFDHPAIKAERENALIARSAGAVPKGRVFNLENGSHYHKNNPLTPEKLKGMIEEGYVVVSLQKEKRLADGTTVKHFVMKKSQMSAERLRRDQLQYRAGGHRMYADKYFAKQAVKGTQPDTGETFLQNPATYMSGTAAEVELWANTMERARILYKSGAEASQLDEVLGPLGYMDGEDFIKHMEDGRFQKDTSFEAMFDRELPEAYLDATSPLDYVDIEETGFTGWLRTNGRMYYSAKGEQLMDWQGNLARTIDPFETTNTALQNVANLASFSDYKMSAVERWVNTYRKYLDIGPNGSVNGVPNASPLTIFSEAKYRSAVDSKPMGGGERIKQAMEAQRDIIRRNLGWRSELDRHTERYTHSLARYIMGDDPTSLQHAVGRKFVGWWEDKNPISAARGIAFDLKLGLFNIAQFPLQIQTIVASVALAGVEHGMPAVLNVMPMRAYLTKAGGEEMLNLWVKRGMASANGMNPQEYKAMMRAAKKSGFFDFGGSHQLINSYGPNATAGGFAQGVDATRRAGRFFFNEGELWNRAVAWQVAWKEVAREFGPVEFSGRQVNTASQTFLNKVALRADDYSMNMMEQSSAVWQKGLLSLPTQFWSYQIRNLEALTGNTFTREQRVRLLLAQTFFYGAAGVPILGAVSTAVEGKTGKASELNTFAGMIDRGMLDHLVYNLTGADVLIGERYGTGQFMTDTIQDLFGMSPYGEKSFVEVMGGATYSITKDSLTAGLKVFSSGVKYVTAESGAKDYPLMKEDIMRLASNVSTYSYLMKAMLVHNYGIMVSNKGTVVATDLPTADAFFVALGMQPGEQDEIAAIMTYKKEKKKLIDEAAKYIVDHRTQWVHQPDQRDEISAQVNAFVRNLDPDIKTEVLKRAQNRTPKSLYEGLSEQMDQERAQAEMIKKYGQPN